MFVLCFVLLAASVRARVWPCYLFKRTAPERFILPAIQAHPPFPFLTSPPPSPPAVCSYYTYLTAFNQRIFTLNLTNLLSFYLIFRAARISFTPFSFPFSFPISLCNLLLPLLSLYWNFIVKFCWRKLNFNYATLASSRLNENIPLAFALIGACCASFALCT